MTFKTNAGIYSCSNKKMALLIKWHCQDIMYILVLQNRWRCPDDTCKKSCSIRHGSFFERSKLSLQQWIVVIHWWIREYPVTRAAEEAKVTEMTAIQCYQYLRDICSWRLTTVDSPLLLGGAGVVVQIDESLFRHKPKVRNIEKCNSTSTQPFS